jgi:hypothetical protein
MLNFADTWTIDALVDARRDDYLGSARRSRASVTGESGRVCVSPVFREMIGCGLVRSGVRFTGIDARQICVRQPGPQGVCVPI